MRTLGRTFSTAASLAALLAFATGCVEKSIYDKTAGQLDLASRSVQQKDQQLRTLEWHVAVLSQQLREAMLRSEAVQRDLGGQVAQLGAERAACVARVVAAEAERERLSTFMAGDGAPAGGRPRPDDLRRLAAALDAQNAKLMERLGRLEQKIDARLPAQRSPPPSPPPHGNPDGI